MEDAEGMRRERLQSLSKNVELTMEDFVTKQENGSVTKQEYDTVFKQEDGTMFKKEDGTVLKQKDGTVFKRENGTVNVIGVDNPAYNYSPETENYQTRL